MAISPDSIIRADDFINSAERDATPTNDAGRVPKLENNGRLDPAFVQPFVEIVTAATDVIPGYALNFVVAGGTHQIGVQNSTSGDGAYKVNSYNTLAQPFQIYDDGPITFTPPIRRGADSSATRNASYTITVDLYEYSSNANKLGTFVQNLLTSTNQNYNSTTLYAVTLPQGHGKTPGKYTIYSKVQETSGGSTGTGDRIRWMGLNTSSQYTANNAVAHIENSYATYYDGTTTQYYSVAANASVTLITYTNPLTGFTQRRYVSSNPSTFYSDIRGFSVAAASAGDPMQMKLRGVIPGFTGLTTGVAYGFNELGVPVAQSNSAYVAISATELFVQ